ncbi:MAG: TolC family protein [Bacteroidales bacterium]|nr:TolC family protein [Bacteroidales bacterium]MCF0201459.1 TolC family protein [Bacteroidales bacterium]
MKRNTLFIGITVLGLASFNSCSLYKNYERPEDLKAEQLYGQSIAEEGEETMATLSWRELYSDPKLQSLIETALQNNTGMKTQEWAIAQAEASLKASKWAFAPSVGLNPAGGYNTAEGWSYQIPLALSWEIDIFGSLRNQKQMASANLQLQQDVQQAVQSRLIANVANCYYQLLALDETKQLISEAIVVWNNMIASAEALMESGEGDAIAVAQFKGQSYDFQAALESVNKNIADLELSICSLLCEAPHSIERDSIMNRPSPSILKTGVSSQLLLNRPDVREAERNLEMFFYNERYAYSNYFPKFTIDAQALFNGQFIASFFGNLAQPIFAQGKIKAQHKTAEAQYEQAKLNLQQKLIDASGDVVAAMNQWNAAHNSIAIRTLQVEEYKKAVDFSHTQMLNGECTYLDVLLAETSLFEKRQSLIEDRLNEMLGIVNLYLSLGGGSQE